MNMFDNEISFNNKFYEDLIVKSKDHAIGLRNKKKSKIHNEKFVAFRITSKKRYNEGNA